MIRRDEEVMPHFYWYLHRCLFVVFSPETQSFSFKCQDNNFGLAFGFLYFFNFMLVYWSSFLVLWTILELSIEFYMYFHKLSRQTPPHQVADSQ